MYRGYTLVNMAMENEPFELYFLGLSQIDSGTPNNHTEDFLQRMINSTSYPP